MSEKSDGGTDESERGPKAGMDESRDAGGDAVPGGKEKKMDPVSRLALLSLLVNLSLVGIKLALSYISGSLALRADAVHSLVDVFGSTALILGIFISGRKSKSFPYGL